MGAVGMMEKDNTVETQESVEKQGHGRARERQWVRLESRGKFGGRVTRGLDGSN